MHSPLQSAPRTVAVTGASGLIGRHLCDHLRRRGWTVRALMRDASVYPFAESGIERARLDLPSVVDGAAFNGVDTVVHAAYATRARTRTEAVQVNEVGTARVVAAARACGVRRLVFVSSLSAHAEATSYYGQSKLELEGRLDLARDLVVRPGLVLAADGGLAQRLWRSVARSPLVPLFGGGRQIVQTVHIADLCEGFERALDRDITGVLRIAEPNGVSMKELLAALAVAIGARPIFVPVPASPAIAVLRVIESLGLPLSFSSENLRGLQALRHFDTAADLSRIELSVRSARESIEELKQSFGDRIGRS